MREIKIGTVYRHFKGKICIVTDIVLDSETLDKIVIYKELCDDYSTWARPYEMFASLVDHQKYPDVTQKYRFEEFKI